MQLLRTLRWRAGAGRPRFAALGTAAVVLVLLAGGTAWGIADAAHTTTLSASATPLTTNTNTGCNVKPARPHFVRCLSIVRTPANHQVTPNVSGPPPGALGPADIQAAYNLPHQGGQTIAIVDANGDSHAEDDLATFRTFYNLPPCTTANGCFTKVDQTGGTNYPADDPGWGVETSLDLDAVSAACPDCHILLVEGNSPSLDDLGTAVDTAVSLGAKYVSNSYGLSGEDPSETSFDHYYDHPGVAVTASSGDTGNLAIWPSTGDKVVSVGGTLLTRDTSTARGWTESAWASGGSGCSQYEPRPDYQLNVSTDCTNRATADISADADPASGLATFDTLGQTGWLQVGGTSLASPLVASMYALAGIPTPNTYPVTYPYHDAHPTTDLFDITQGSNGTCGNLLCNAGPGWDGPTGLGTPNGVAALTFGPHGQLTGQVTDAATGKPLSGATVTAEPGNYTTRTDSNGTYQLDLAAGGYDLKVTSYGYQPATKSGIQISQDQTTTVSFTLTAEAFGTLSGAVTDGSGHGWPLHAQITIPGYPNGPIWTDPYTGRYSVTLPQGDYPLSISTDYPGYPDKQVPVTIGANTTKDIPLAADLKACTAPGYGPNGSGEGFTGWTGATARNGWNLTGSGWRFDNPGNRQPPTTPPYLLTGGDDAFAVADSGYTGGQVDTTLTSPTVDLSGQSTPQLQFDTAYYAASQQSATVQISTDGGRTWTTVWHQTSSNAIDHITLDVPAAAGRSTVKVRFHYTGHDGWYWAIDNVLLGTPTCTPLPGGLLTGVVTDQASGQPVNGAQISGPVSPQQQGWQAGLSQITADPTLPGGFYWLFTPAGSQSLTATATGYTPANATVDVNAGTVIRHDWALTKAGG